MDNKVDIWKNNCCAKKLFNELSTSKVRYHDVASYEDLLNVMKSIN